MNEERILNGPGGFQVFYTMRAKRWRREDRDQDQDRGSGLNQDPARSAVSLKHHRARTTAALN